MKNQNQSLSETLRLASQYENEFGVQLNADGTSAAKFPENGKAFSLKELQASVGGLIELAVIEFGSGKTADLWFNEEGKLLDLPVNPGASALWRETFGPHDVIVGNALLVFNHKEEDEE